MRNETPRNPQAGFSLIELLVVITIIGILATVVVVNVGGSTDQAKVTAAKAHLKQLDTAVDRYRMDHGVWPESIEDLRRGPNHPVTDEPTSYLTELPNDPWAGEPYLMEYDDRDRPYFFSYGADMGDGGQGINRDLYSNGQGEE